MSIEAIKAHVQAQAMRWTSHAATRMLQRGVRREDAAAALFQGEIIAWYDDENPYPSCLVLGRTEEGKALHIVCADDGAQLWIITAYWPNLLEWDNDFRTRRRN